MKKTDNNSESRGMQIALLIFGALATVIWAVVDCLDVLGIRETTAAEGCCGRLLKEEVQS